MSSNILALAGLPASGKTTFAQTLLHENVTRYYLENKFMTEDQKNNIVYCNFDYAMILNKRKTKKPIEILYQQLFDQIKDNMFYNNKKWTFILDGLFINHQDYIRIASAFKTCTITFHYWFPLREVCAFNDKYRRGEDSINLIMNLPFEQPEPVVIKLVAGHESEIIMEQHTPIKKSGYNLFRDKYCIGTEFTSGSWSNGGISFDCYGHTHNSSFESVLASFQEFDELIELINEDIKFMQYRKLYNASVDTSSDCGYYGGSSTSSNYTCDTKKLYNLLVELDLLPEEFL